MLIVIKKVISFNLFYVNISLGMVTHLIYHK